MSRKLSYACALSALFLALAGSTPASAQFNYSVKFVCGYNPSNVGWSQSGNSEGEPSVKFGNYATEINLVNPSLTTTADIRKHVILLVKEGFPVGREPKVSGVVGVDGISLKSLEATMDDCNRIWELVYGSPAPNPYPLTIGFLVLQSTREIDVTAVYTAQTCANWVNSPEKLECLDPDGRFTDASVSIDVEQIAGRKLF